MVCRLDRYSYKTVQHSKMANNLLYKLFSQGGPLVLGIQLVLEVQGDPEIMNR